MKTPALFELDSSPAMAETSSTLLRTGGDGVLRALFAPLYSFRVRIAVVFGSLAAVLCGVAALALGDMMTGEIRRASVHSLDTIAGNAARALASGMSQRLLETRVLAESSALWADGLDSPAVAQALARAQNAQRFNAWIGVADTSGRVRSAVSGLLVGKNVKLRPWFGQALAGAYVGDVHRAELLETLLPKPADGEPIRFVDFAAPIRVEGKVIGVLGVHGTWDWSREVIASLMPADAPERGIEVFIFDRAGKVLSSPPNASHETTASIDELHPVPYAATLNGKAAEVVAWPDGLVYLTSAVALPAENSVADLGWRIVAREPVDKAFARSRAASQKALGLGALLATVAGVLAWFAAGVLGRPLMTLANAARDVQNHVPGASIEVLRDNREVQHLSTALASMTRRLDETYRTAPIGMCQTDLDGVVLSANERLGAILGIEAAALPRRRLVEFMAQADRAGFSDDLRRVARVGLATLSKEVCVTRQDGHEVRVSISAAMVAAIDDASPYLIVVIEDVSLRIAAEASDRANAAKTAFLSQVSHELRTPLNAVLGFSQLLKLDGEERLTERQLQRVSAITGAGRHLLAMIDDLLDLTQIESDRMRLSIEPVSLRAVLEEAMSLTSGAARSANISLSATGSAASFDDHVLADQVRLRQVLLNLLGNAVKYNRPGGTVTVDWTVLEDEARIELTVTDTGRGLRPEKLAQLFQPFNRLGAESSGVQGTGIGLVITRKLVELMGGQINVRSTPGIGSAFSVSLPISSPRLFEPALVTAPMPLDETLAPAGRRLTVMYAEDNELNVLLLSAALEMRPGLRLVIARDGNEALRMAEASPPDIFILDMHLGDMTGMELAAGLRHIASLSAVPMIALSADSTEFAAEAAAEAGFVAYLTKPLDLRKLLQTLDKAAPTAGLWSSHRLPDSIR